VATGPFPFKATLTWQVSWTGSGNTGGTLPDGTFGTTTPLTVQEIQTVVVQ
jgi:enoyl reductase